MEGPKLSTMAWRNIWRNGRRTLVTLSGIAFGVLLAVIFTAIGDDSYTKTIDLAARMGGGHVAVQHPEYLDTPSLKRTVKNAPALVELAKKERYVERVVTRVTGHTMLATAANSYGAFFIAFDPKQEDESTLSILESIDEGEVFPDTKGRGIILGAQLAENLGTKLGRKVVYTLTDKHGEIVSGLARVSGIIRTGAPTVDGAVALLPIDAVRDVLGYDADEATQVGIFIDDQRRSVEVADALRPKIDSDAVVTWRDTQPDVAGYVAVDSAGAIVFEFIIMILVSAGIFNTLFVSVMERMREFGVLMAIGFSPSHLFRLVVWESLFLGLVGLVAAAVVTVGPYYYLNTTGIDFSGMMPEGTEVSGIAVELVMYADIFPEKLFIIGALVLGATLLSGLYPAWRAGRVVPVETIKLV